MPSEPPVELIERQLASIHRPRVDIPACDPELELELVELWASTHGADAGRCAGASEDLAPWRSGIRGGLWLLLAGHRLAVACFALVVVLAGACALPTSYDIPLGLEVEIRTGAGGLPAREIVDYVQSRADAGEVDVIVRELVRDDRAESVMRIRMWDQSLALGELEPQLREQFPVLGEAEIDERPLEGEIDTVWGRRLAHAAFDLSLRESDVEQARLELLVRLQRQGFDENEVTVKVRDREDGHREVEVSIESHRDLEDGDLDVLRDEFELGPELHWVSDPRGPEAIEVPGGHRHGPLRIELRPAGGPGEGAR